jgi:hypothetical protein
MEQNIFEVLKIISKLQESVGNVRISYNMNIKFMRKTALSGFELFKT